MSWEHISPDILRLVSGTVLNHPGVLHSVTFALFSEAAFVAQQPECGVCCEDGSSQCEQTLMVLVPLSLLCSYIAMQE